MQALHSNKKAQVNAKYASSFQIYFNKSNSCIKICRQFLSAQLMTEDPNGNARIPSMMVSATRNITQNYAFHKWVS